MRVTLLLEGRIAGPWTAVLDRECRGLLARGANVTLDFQGVSSVDEQGFTILRAFPVPTAGDDGPGVSVTNETAFVQHRMGRS